MFEDRVELCSPGALPNNLTIESMGERQATRNEVLTSALGRMPVAGLSGASGRQFFMERRGDGVPIIRRETEELCGRLPNFRLIDGSELCLTIPAAALDPTPANTVITVRGAGQPLAGVDILTLFPNKTWKQATTDGNGTARIALHSTHLPMTVFAATSGFAAHCEHDWVPAQRTLELELYARSDGGSVIFPEVSGHIPGLTGRLNPKLDTLGRTYLYASNIAINEGRQQPVHFLLGEDMCLTDADGREMLVRIVDITGRSALVEYRLVPKSALVEPPHCTLRKRED